MILEAGIPLTKIIINMAASHCNLTLGFSIKSGGTGTWIAPIRPPS